MSLRFLLRDTDHGRLQATAAKSGWSLMTPELFISGDTVVQNGTRHAWRNKGTKPVTMLFFLNGARD
jgi:hypothetical protein